MKESPFLEAVSTLVGTVIGAGVLGMPYLIAKAGLLNGILLILILGIAVTIMYLYYGEVILRTKKIHQLTGYAEKYLGKTGKIVATFSFVISVYGAIIAYIIGAGSTISALLGGQSLVYSVGFLIVGTVLVFIGIKAIEQSEPILMIFVLVMICLICFFSVGKMQQANFTGFDLDNLLVPYGLVLFALLGTNALPEMREELAGNEKMFRKSIILGMAVPILLYIVFSTVVVGVVGKTGFEMLSENSRIATIALIPYIGEHMAVFGNIFAVFAMATSFLAVSLSLKEMFIFDFGLDEKLALGLTFLPPTVVAFSGLTSFIQVIDLMGVVVGGITGFLIIFMFWSAKKKGDRKPEYAISGQKAVGIAILLLLLIGTVYKLIGG